MILLLPCRWPTSLQSHIKVQITSINGAANTANCIKLKLQKHFPTHSAALEAILATSNPWVLLSSALEEQMTWTTSFKISAILKYSMIIVKDVKCPRCFQNNIVQYKLLCLSKYKTSTAFLEEQISSSQDTDWVDLLPCWRQRRLPKFMELSMQCILLGLAGLAI